jgi:hypothetical protein
MKDLTHGQAATRLRRLATEAEQSRFVVLPERLRKIANDLERFDKQCLDRATAALRGPGAAPVGHPSASDEAADRARLELDERTYSDGLRKALTRYMGLGNAMLHGMSLETARRDIEDAHLQARAAIDAARSQGKERTL